MSLILLLHHALSSMAAIKLTIPMATANSVMSKAYGCLRLYERCLFQ
jgi:hypothetical protein